MKYGNIEVEQINRQSEVVCDVDESYTTSELGMVLKKYFPIVDTKEQLNIAEYEDNKFAIYPKNVTYLGTPHPGFKKRVQLGDNFKRYFNMYAARGIQLLIIGIYHYKGTLIFVDFDTVKYAQNKSHNSSAHVFVSDLQQALYKGIYTRTDIQGNRITTFAPTAVSEFLQQKFVSGLSGRNEIVEVLDDFFMTLGKEWDGVDCYKEMADAKFHDALQVEWPAAYLEHRCEQYLKRYPQAQKIVRYQQNKKKGEIDLDLFFSKENSYGDLKCHTLGKGSIPGNSCESIEKALLEGSVYYVVCNHETIMDREQGYVTRKYWNTMRAKMRNQAASSNSRIKGRVFLKNYMILEINSLNKGYLKSFQKGFKNSGKNSRPRKEKIMISEKDFSDFVIHKKEL